MIEVDQNGQNKCVEACAGVLVAAEQPQGYLRCIAACPDDAPLYVRLNRSCVARCPALYDPGAEACVDACGGDHPYAPAEDQQGVDALRCTRCADGFVVLPESGSWGLCYVRCPAGRVPVDGVCVV